LEISPTFQHRRCSKRTDHVLLEADRSHATNSGERIWLVRSVTASYNEPSQNGEALVETTVAGIDTGSQLFETWIPDGGFEVQRRKVEGAVVECLVPKWGQDEVFTSRPCHEEPCLHRLLAECPVDHVAEFAGRYGLLTFSIPRHQVGRKLRAAEVFQPQPLALWQDQIRRLRSAADLWDRIVAGKDADVHQARALLGRKLTQAKRWPACGSSSPSHPRARTISSP